MATKTVLISDAVSNLIDLDGSVQWKGESWNADDIVEFEDGTYTGIRIRIRNMPTAVGEVMTFTNNGGQAIFPGDGTYTWYWSDGGDNFVIDGTGDPATTYGIKITTDRMRLDGDCSNIEIKNVEFSTSNNATGIALHWPQGADSVIDGVEIHSCWFHDNDQEAIYIGSNSPSATRYNENINIHDNLFEDNSEDINVKGCAGQLEIRDNTMTGTHPGTASETVGSISIANGGKSGQYGYIERNWIKDCDGRGIYYQEGDGSTSETMFIQNNVLINCGSHATSNRNDGILVQSSGPNVRLMNNTIRNTGNGTAGRGIRITTSRHYAFNNLVFESDDEDMSKAAAVPAGNWGNNITSDATGTDSTVRSTASLDFVDEAADNYRLLSTSPAVDHGTSTNAPSDDHEQFPRTDGSPDAGAYELRPNDFYYYVNQQ